MNPRKANILVIDDKLENLRLLIGILSQEGYEVRPASNGQFALLSARTTPPDLILLDIKMPHLDGYMICEQLKANELTRDIPVIFLSALEDAQDKVKAFEVGGVDYITKPFQAQEVLMRVKTHLLLHRLRNHFEDLVTERTAELSKALTEIQRLKDQLQTENMYLREEIKCEHNFEEIIGQSAPLKSLLVSVQKVAPTDATTLIHGETGTGKELIARAIHATSQRRDRPLIKVNCAALPTHLIESELFGHEKGAFTGASSQRIGRFELADKATIFLDEIGELPVELQPKLLRVLQEGTFERVGSSRTREVDVRVIAATNRDLQTEVQAGRFRQDLYYRLSVFPIFVPPLRERTEDIPFLLEAFVQKFNKKLGKSIEAIPQPILDALQQYAWPGNIRELENIVERAVISTEGSTLQLELPSVPAPSDHESLQSLANMERAHILRVLEAKLWRIEGPKGAAAVLELHPNTLRFRMKKLGITRPEH